MNEYDFDASAFLPKDNRLKGDMLEQTGWDGHPVTICRFGKKTYDATEDRPGDTKLQVFFTELGDYPLECNARQLKKLIELFGERTSGWMGKQVVLMSADAGTFKGQPCKTITVKEVRTAPPGMPAVMPPAAAAMPVQPPPARSATNAPAPMGIDEGDPFAEDPITPAQLAEIETLCAQLNMNPVLVSQNQYHANPDKLDMSQASDFLTKLKKKAAQTSEAMRR